MSHFLKYKWVLLQKNGDITIGKVYKTRKIARKWKKYFDKNLSYLAGSKVAKVRVEVVDVPVS